MFRFLILCVALLASPTWAQYRPDRQFVVQTPCKIGWLAKYNVTNCVIVGEHIREGGDPGLRGGIKWDGLPALLMSGKARSFALVYYYSDVSDSQWSNGQITVWDGQRYINSEQSEDHPAVIFRITHDGGKTWSKFYTPYRNRVSSNYINN